MFIRIPSDFWESEGRMILLSSGLRGVGVLSVIMSELMSGDKTIEQLRSCKSLENEDEEFVEYVVELCLQEEVLMISENMISSAISSESAKYYNSVTERSRKAGSSKSLIIEEAGVTNSPKIHFSIKDFIERYNEVRMSKIPTARKVSIIDDKTKRQFTRLVKQYGRSDFFTVMSNAFNDPYHIESKFKYLTPELITRQDKFSRFLLMPVIVDESSLDGYDRNKHNNDKFKKVIESSKITYKIKM
jgi:hypothetical protein